MKQVQKQGKLQFFKEKAATKLPLRLSNLQFFAEGEGADTSAEGADSNQTGEGTDGGGQQQDPQLDEATKAFIEKMVQSAEDKVRTKYTKQLSATQKELENYKTASMTAQEKAEYEMQELQKTLEEREQTLHQKEMRSIAVDGITASKIDLEPQEIAELADVIVGKDEEDTNRRLKVICSTLFSKAMQRTVDKKFKEAGREIYGGAGTGATFTRQQVESMSQTEINENWTQIQKDMRTWK